MPGHYCVRPVGVAGGKCLDKLAMLMRRTGQLTLAIARRRSLDDRLLGQRRKHRRQAGAGGRRDENIVKTPVVFEKGGDVRRVRSHLRRQSRIDGTQIVKRRRADPRRRTRRSMRLQHRAQREHFGQVVVVPVGDH